MDARPAKKKYDPAATCGGSTDAGRVMNMEILEPVEGTEASKSNSNLHASSEHYEEAPPLGKSQFESWNEFHEHVQAYQSRTCQLFRVRTNTTAAERNVKIKRSKNPTSTTIPIDLEYHAKTLVCTHSGKYKSRGSGKRLRQESRQTSCKAQINACAQVIDKAVGKFAICDTKCSLFHSHILSERVYDQYASVRTALEPDVLKTVDVLRKAGAKKSGIRKYILENSAHQPTNRDVHNLVRSLKEREQGLGRTTSAKRLRVWMTELCEEDGNVGRIFVDRTSEKVVAACITLQTKQMRSMFAQFPEVVLIDATHGTNAPKYKVFSFMAHDAFGHGQFVQHALVQNERRPTLLIAINECKQNNPDWIRIKCVLVDKDFTEMAVLKTAFPDATILLCQFHVIKYLREQIACSDYGLNSWQKDHLRATVNLLVYARTEREYEKFRKYMQYVLAMGPPASASAGLLAPDAETSLDDEHSASRERSSVVDPGQDGEGLLRPHCDESILPSDKPRSPSESPLLHPFEVYFAKNWGSCRELWCAHKRENAVTLGNNTNNRLESSWKQLKEWVDSFMELDECIASIMYYRSL